MTKIAGKDENEFEKAWRDFMFEFGYAFGFIWLVNKCKYLKLKDYYQKRLDERLDEIG